MDEVLFGVLAEHVDTYLAQADRQCQAADVRRLVAAWRAILDIHRPEGRTGRCGGCGKGRRRLARSNPRDGMCNVWRVANAFFVAAHPRPTHPQPAPGHRPARSRRRADPEPH